MKFQPERFQKLVQILKGTGEVEDPLREAYLFLRAFQSETLSTTQKELLWDCAALRKKQAAAHCLGRVGWGGQWIQTPYPLLIPRPETEQLLDSLRRLPDPRVVWDLCCGTGNIGAFVHQHFPQSRIHSLDVDFLALLTTLHQGFPTQVYQTDLTQDEEKNWPTEAPDWVLCNPPYLTPEEWEMSPLRERESKQALWGGKEGLEIPLAIFKQVQKRTQGNPLFAFELSQTTCRSFLKYLDVQAQKISNLHTEAFHKCIHEEKVCVLTDWEDRELFIVGKKGAFKTF